MTGNYANSVNLPETLKTCGVPHEVDPDDAINNGRVIEIVTAGDQKKRFFSPGGNVCFTMLAGAIYAGAVEDYINAKFTLKKANYRERSCNTRMASSPTKS